MPKNVSRHATLSESFPEVAAEWHPSKNGDKLPQNFLPKSNKKVWWLCSRGHDWPAIISSRTAGSKCPYCSGKKVSPGFNDLATLDPELAKQWHPTLNTQLILFSN